MHVFMCVCAHFKILKYWNMFSYSKQVMHITCRGSTPLLAVFLSKLLYYLTPNTIPFLAGEATEVVIFYAKLYTLF